jgi:hypothetical protein
MNGGPYAARRHVERSYLSSGRPGRLGDRGHERLRARGQSPVERAGPRDRRLYSPTGSQLTARCRAGRGCARDPRRRGTGVPSPEGYGGGAPAGVPRERASLRRQPGNRLRPDPRALLAVGPGRRALAGPLARAGGRHVSHPRADEEPRAGLRPGARERAARRSRAAHDGPGRPRDRGHGGRPSADAGALPVAAEQDLGGAGWGRPGAVPAPGPGRGARGARDSRAEGAVVRRAHSAPEGDRSAPAGDRASPAGAPRLGGRAARADRRGPASGQR